MAASGVWSIEQLFKIGEHAVDPLRTLSCVEYDSTLVAVDALVSGRLQKPEGYCALYSPSDNCHVVLYRSDKEAEARSLFLRPYSTLVRASSLTEAFGQSTTRWHVDLAFPLPEARLDRSRVLANDQADSITGAVKFLNSGAMPSPPRFCIVYSASTSRYFVLFQDGCEAEARTYFKVHVYGSPARLFSAKTVISETHCIMHLAVLLYRLLEFCANVLMFCFATWILHPVIYVSAFVLLWYLPATLHMRGWRRPILYPLVNFVVDDFSFHNIHPTPRNATCVYVFAVVRVAFLLVFVPMVAPPHFSKFSVPFMSVFRNEPAIGQMTKVFYDANSKQLAKLIVSLTGLAIFLFFVAGIVWICIVVHMLTVRSCAGYASPICGEKDESMLERIDELGAQLELVSNLEPKECFAELMRLKRTRPKFKHAGFFPTFGPAWAVVLHIGLDLFNAFNFFNSGDYWRTVALAVLVLITIFYVSNLTEHGLLSIYTECKRSWDSGIFTRDYMTFVRADKGIQSIPSLVLTVSGLPFTVSRPTDMFGCIGALVTTTCVLVPFINREYDYGVEQEIVVPAEDLTTASVSAELLLSQS
eukprot:TRINITY_DN5393_c0_g1_i1.p1 TRINITY_DN5393_c0_g1~~TRINITY_DN5393_c0_g1_i1.p1  ORF type:complete len:608 (+),score=56.02 TRINITY_DN5393_c0_g1_i1:64-1824(+)